MSRQPKNWMYPNQVYVASGGACANTLLFEDKYCHELFFKYLNTFLKPMVKILHYKFTATEWALLIQTKSEEEIKAAYLKQRKKSKTADREKDHIEAHRMISEHFRMLLSNFAKECNAYRERKGTIVMKRFDKFPITSQIDYYHEFERICDLKFCNYRQTKEKYKPDESMYDKEKEMNYSNGFPHPMRSSLGVYDGLLKIESLPISLELVRPNSHVLRKILNDAKKGKNHKKPPPKKE